MDFLDQLGKKISNAGKDVAQQANIFAETTRLNNFIAEKDFSIFKGRDKLLAVGEIGLDYFYDFFRFSFLFYID